MRTADSRVRGIRIVDERLDPRAHLRVPERVQRADRRLPDGGVFVGEQRQQRRRTPAGSPIRASAPAVATASARSARRSGVSAGTARRSPSRPSAPIAARRVSSSLGPELLDDQIDHAGILADDGLDHAGADGGLSEQAGQRLLDGRPAQPAEQRSRDGGACRRRRTPAAPRRAAARAPAGCSDAWNSLLM